MPDLLDNGRQAAHCALRARHLRCSQASEGKSPEAASQMTYRLVRMHLSGTRYITHAHQSKSLGGGHCQTYWTMADKLLIEPYVPAISDMAKHLKAGIRLECPAEVRHAFNSAPCHGNHITNTSHALYCSQPLSAQCNVPEASFRLKPCFMQGTFGSLLLIRGYI